MMMYEKEKKKNFWRLDLDCGGKDETVGRWRHYRASKQGLLSRCDGTGGRVPGSLAGWLMDMMKALAYLF